MSNSMLPQRTLLLASFIAISSLLPSARGQSISGAIVGAVVDQSNLPVAGAQVALTQVATGARRQAATNMSGRFFFGSLQPGAYNLAIENQGFKRLERRGLNLTAAETLDIGNLMLEVGSVAESVEVTAQGAVVQTASAERSGVITGSQVESLAIKGRNVMSLLQLLPGVVDTSDPAQIQSAWEVYTLGNRRNTNNVSLDGATMNAIGNNFNGVVSVSMDAVAEVKVLLSNYQAEYGRMSGANVHIVSKSGTRSFHGLGSYFKRHEQFNANNFFNNLLGQPKPRYRYNTWNYNVGGPVYIPGKFNTGRDKLFFFWLQEFWPIKATSAVTRITVPTELERQGDFSQTLDVNNQLIAVTDPFNNRQPFPGNRIPVSRVDTNGQALLSIFPAPNFLDRSVSRGNYNYVFQAPRETPTRTETLKLDYHLNSNNILSVNFTHKKEEQKGALGVPSSVSNWPRIRQSSLNEGRLLAFQYRKIFSPTLISETSASYSWRPWNNTANLDDLSRNQRNTAGYKLAQFNPSNNPLNLVPQATFGGVPSAANLTMDGRFPLTSDHDILTLATNLAKVVGTRTLKAGLYVDTVWALNSNGVAFNGRFSFDRNVNNPFDTNYAYSNAALGVFNTYTEASARPFSRAVARNIEWFLQDNWKVTRRLTLDYGMRFYLVAPSFIKEDRLSAFAPDRFDPRRQARLIQPAMANGQRVGVHPLTGQVYPAPLIGAMAPGAGDPNNGLVVAAEDSSYPRGLIDDRGVHFGPRLGFAYDVFGNGRTAVRGGFGVFYNRVAQSDLLYSYAEQAPMVQNPVIYFGTMATLLNSSGFLFPTDILGVDKIGKVPTVMNHSFSVQHNVGFGTVVEAAYVGSLGRHLLWSKNLNAIPFGTNFNPANIDKTTNRPLAPAFLRTYPGYNNVNYREWAGSSNYHSLQVSANRRFARGIQFGASWTWSKAMDFNDGDTETVSTLVPVRVWNYGLASFDRTHVLKINWLWELPKGAWANPVLKRVLNDWQLSGIASFVSGMPVGVDYSLVTATDITGSPTDGARIVVTANPVLPKTERTFERYFRTDVFQAPVIGTIGNAARTLLRAPGINNWDLAIFKDFPIREQVRLQFRWELYNAFNHTQFSGIDTSARFDSAGRQVDNLFGQVTSSRDARRMQFALRFYF